MPLSFADRRNHPVLVPECQASGMIAVVRSLGRAGYPVHACASTTDALGLSSAYAVRAVVHPPYADPEFIGWLRAYIRAEQIASVVPSEGLLLAIRAHYAEFSPFLPDRVPADIAYGCLSKVVTTRVFLAHADERLRHHLPNSVIVEDQDESPLAERLQGWQWPLVAKADGAFARDGHSGWVQTVSGLAAMEAVVADALRSHRCCLIQEMVPGCKATVNLFVHGGVVRAESMCCAEHENPHTGGLTTYRRTWWHEEMAADARRRVEALGWQGVAMVEYKWDPATGRFWFIEINSRYWAALNMDLLAGKDFPRLQLDAHLGGDESSLGAGLQGMRCRLTFPADAGFLLSLLRDRSVRLSRKLRAVAEAVLLSLDPRVRSDYWFPGDRLLYLRALWNYVVRIGRG